MSIYLGSHKINGLYLGSQKIGSIYLGSQKVYSSAPAIPYVTIGNQIWMSVNLAIDDGQGGITTKTVQYDVYSEEEVVEYYYTWDAAVRVANSIAGWHLPSNDEWTTLVNTVGSSPGKKLKSTYGWNNSGNGTDDYGFCALPAGSVNGGTLSNFGTYAYIWTSSTSGSSAYRRRLSYSSSTSVQSNTAGKYYGYSVRLVKDS